MAIHEGTTHLILKENDTVLEGNYYTGRGRGNTGRMKLRKTKTPFFEWIRFWEKNDGLTPSLLVNQ